MTNTKTRKFNQSTLKRIICNPSSDPRHLWLSAHLYCCPHKCASWPSGVGTFQVFPCPAVPNNGNHTCINIIRKINWHQPGFHCHLLPSQDQQHTESFGLQGNPRTTWWGIEPPSWSGPTASSSVVEPPPAGPHSRDGFPQVPTHQPGDLMMLKFKKAIGHMRRDLISALAQVQEGHIKF